MKMVNEDLPNVTQFYNDRIVLVTGGTGFLGRVLIEKLLRDLNIKKIYLLVRPKDKRSAKERISKMFEETIFYPLRAQDANIFNKVCPIDVNFQADDLSLDANLKNILINEVEIVFNIIASVKFNEKVREAIETNVTSTKRILDLVLQMKRLASFVHISTLYSNCDHSCIKEKVYPLELGYEKIIQLTKILDDNSLNFILPCLIGDLPNTYTMTKRCAEDMVNHLGHHLPAGIFRPPIVLSTYKEPFPGWTDNLNGPSGLCSWTVKGFIHSIWGDSSKRANLVPVDYCINAMLAAACDINRKFEKRIRNNIKMPVYNYIYAENNLTWGKYMDLVPLGFHEPFNEVMWYYSYKIFRSKCMYKIAAFFFHTIPGYTLDLIAFLMGKKTNVMKGYRKADQVIQMMAYFGLREWQFENDNIRELYSSLGEEDRKKFEFHFQTIDWKQYFQYYIPGIKRYYMKEDSCVRALHESRKNFNRMRFCHSMIKRFLWFIFFCKTSNLIWVLLRNILKIHL